MIAYNSKHLQRQIDDIDTTSDLLTSRAGLTPFCRYVRSIGIDQKLDRYFGKMRKNRKGMPAFDMFVQMFCFFLDGTSRHISYFDTLKQDHGYAAGLEYTLDQLASSHSIKRFFRSFSYQRNRCFRRLLQDIFIWRLKLSKPSVIIIDIDTMVMDNDDAVRRHGVSPTYKNVKGFQPLQIKWGAFVIDAVFRGGKKHSNHGDTVKNALSHLVKRIREKYSATVPIIITTDCGFFDQDIFGYCEDVLKIGYVCSGKLYGDIIDYVDNLTCDKFATYSKPSGGEGITEWQYTQFYDRRGSWNKDRRAIYTRAVCEKGQLYLISHDCIYYTNIGITPELTAQLLQAGCGDYLETASIVRLAHERGTAELVHRHLKDFGFEQMPFEKFFMNEAFYFTLLVAFNLYESYKRDCCAKVISTAVYPTTFRRELIDFAGKIVSHARRIILKVTSVIFEKLHHIWRKANCPPVMT